MRGPFRLWHREKVTSGLGFSFALQAGLLFPNKEDTNETEVNSDFICFIYLIIQKPN